MIHIDGSLGEGGGQILRTALCLSLVTGKAFTIKNIRGGRKKPGLLRQHLTAVKAAAEVGKAGTEGLRIGSEELIFRPEGIVPGDYRFQVGTAGSAMLVLQTVLPALLFGRVPSSLVIEGGTHNPFAPPYDFFREAFLPCLKKMGAEIDCELGKHGFYPAGGGEVSVKVFPVEKLCPLEIVERGELVRKEVAGLTARIPVSIAENEVSRIVKKMEWEPEIGCSCEVESEGPGNVVFVKLDYKNIAEVFTGFGQFGVSGKKIADRVSNRVKQYLKSGMPVGEYLADQLLIPLSLAGAGKFRTHRISGHTKTNAAIIEMFLNVCIAYRDLGEGNWEVEVEERKNGMD